MTKQDKTDLEKLREASRLKALLLVAINNPNIATQRAEALSNSLVEVNKNLKPSNN